MCICYSCSVLFLSPLVSVNDGIYDCIIVISGVEAGKKAAGEVLALQKRVLAVLNAARYDINYIFDEIKNGLIVS